MRNRAGGSLAAVLTLIAFLGASCAGGDELVIGVATSVQDSGLLDELVEGFKAENPDAGSLKPVAAGSGQLLELARRGEVDVIISHSPAAEEELLAAGDLIERRPLMFNLFLIIGPEDDPASVGSAASLPEAFRRIAEAEATFVSRGDRSGTHVREIAVWEEAGIEPRGESWYQESGAGQGQSLLVASDKDAYALVDSATWTALEDRTDLVAYLTDVEVPNRYSVSRVNPDKGDVSEKAARAFADFLTSPAGQLLIEEFGREEYGLPLFQPEGAAPDATPSPVSTP